MSDHATVPSLPRTRRSARLQAVEADLQVQNQIIGSNVNLDRLTVLPPEILIMIWERLFIPHEPDTTTHPNEFIPLHSRLLYVQRTNLYRHVVLNDRGSLSRFAASLKRNKRLGELVERLTFNEMMEWGGGARLSATLQSITSRLHRCTSLEAPPSISTLLYQIDTPHGPFLSQLVHLTLKFFSYDQSCYSRLNPLSPSLCMLQIKYPDLASVAPVPVSIVTSTIQPSNSYHHLDRLDIEDTNFRHPDLQHLLSSVSARDVTLQGQEVKAGLEALRNPSVTVHVRANEYVRDGSPTFDSTLLRFKNLESLQLDEDVDVTDEFYTSLAQAFPKLQTFIAGEWFKLNAQALLKAIPQLPSSFKSLQLFNVEIQKNGSEQWEDWEAADWPIECQPMDLLCLIEAAEERGIRLTGTAPDALDFEVARYEEAEDAKEEMMAEMGWEALGEF